MAWVGQTSRPVSYTHLDVYKRQAHILSGALFEPRALDELLPDWRAMGAPLNTPVSEDRVYLYRSQSAATKLPGFAVPAPMHNAGNTIISLGSLCRWLAEQAEAAGVEIFPGFAAAEVLYHDDGSVKGVATGDLGRDKKGEPKDSFQPGIELHARYTPVSYTHLDVYKRHPS